MLGDGKYVEEHRVPVLPSALAQPLGQGSYSSNPDIAPTTHDIFVQIQLSRQGTTFYPHYSGSLANWAKCRPPSHTSTSIEFSQSSTLTAARRLSRTIPDSCCSSVLAFPRTPIGVLSFASPKKPGGSFLLGGDEQEETIARLSSLVASLSSPAAQDFYKEHKKYKAEDGSGLHDHSLVYSPGVVVFRKDGDDISDDTSDRPRHTSDIAIGGQFIAPYTINVVSAVPVNAAAVRQKHDIAPTDVQLFEDGIRDTMKERMARALRLFEAHGNKTVILGAFGCSSSQNNVEFVASIWAELLACGEEARFKDVFERVMFAVPGRLYESFKKAFEMRVFEAELTKATSED